MKKIHIIGVAWYKRENFAPLLALFEDRSTIRLSYKQWLAAAEARVEQHQREGRKVIKIDIDPVEFPFWCATEGLVPNAQARIAYTNFVVGKLGASQ